MHIPYLAVEVVRVGLIIITMMFYYSRYFTKYCRGYTFIKSDTGLISWYTKYILFMIIIIKIIPHHCVMKQTKFPYILAFEKKSKHSFESMCEWSNIDGFNFVSLVQRKKQWKIRMNEHNHIRGLLRTIKIK